MVDILFVVLVVEFGNFVYIDMGLLFSVGLLVFVNGFGFILLV